MSRSNSFIRKLLGLMICVLAIVPSPSAAQIPTATISGRVLDSGGLPAPGVSVTAQSPSLQGTNKTTTSQDGYYTFRLLPPGTYTITFQKSGFAASKESRTVAATESIVIDITLKPETVTENVTVTPDTGIFANTVQAATSIKHDLLASLPTQRTLLAAVALAPGVHATGPSNGVSMGGAMSFENSFMLNGVQIQDNLRGTPFDLFIEDAIQETTIATSGISAEYGRFTGGVVNAITKSGGNTFGGSFRTTFSNDNWRTQSPFGEPKTDNLVPTYEMTFGGPVRTNSTWFFGAARFFDQVAADETGYTGISFNTKDNEKRFEGKVTQRFGNNHNLQVAYTGIREEQVNNAFPSASLVMDLASLTTRELPQNLISAHYTGTYGSRLVLEGQFSMRKFTFEHDGGLSRDLIKGTLLEDQQTGANWWAPAFCGVCLNEQRDNNDFLVKGSYFMTGKRGAHDVTFGYDLFNDKLKGDNHQSGSDYHVWTTTSTIQNDVVYPVIAGDDSTWIIWWPIRATSQGTNFRTHSLFVNDAWRMDSHWSFNLGLRYDKNQGDDASGQKVANDSAVSPRVGAIFDPAGNGKLTFNVSYGRYVAAVANNIANAAAPNGTPSIIGFFYEGPDINLTPGAPLVSSEAALQQVFNWFNANGGTNRDPFFVKIPGVQLQIRQSLASPHADEFAFGVSHQIGTRGAIRADFLRRTWGNFYANRVDTTTGKVTDEFGQTFDLNLTENTDALNRDYTALNVQGSYRYGARTTVGGSYTLSKLHGNINGENINSGPITSDILSYPEYFDRKWSFPDGDLSADQRHRARIWANVDLPWDGKYGRVSLGVVEVLQSGTPYGAVGSVRTGALVPDKGYETPPATVNYFFTSRDAFHTDSEYRTDLAVNYAWKIPSARKAEFYAQAQLLNLFNQFQVFNTAGGEINTTVLTSVDDPRRFKSFNPFTETPVRGVNWDTGDKFGQPIDAGAYTLPRTFFFALGVRF